MTTRGPSDVCITCQHYLGKHKCKAYPNYIPPSILCLEAPQEKCGKLKYKQCAKKAPSYGEGYNLPPEELERRGYLYQY